MLHCHHSGGIRFELSDTELVLYYPDGQRFASFVELAQQREIERQRAEEAEARAAQAQTQLQALRALLQERGIDPTQL
ncbi:hypothetical protein NDI37_08340 [Funiculus sociatus GB2-A5]|uniref:Uma2 family endonuclease n=1 Tax=Funiculus sociatus GB2-A5 TaxID=2933946 RepID=A0ABV0JM35_9CYAN|nr:MULTISPECIES: hypothetical protein [unclassified Trichocoleus]MBD1904841.1 hypothetical protein [Trichocoleus sp. FACHB-832]MBD2064600.1 hypothetical protein [Trichocoleus sp. FACHB-6]